MTVVCSILELIKILQQESFKITYINTFSTKVLKYDKSFYYLVDGWPIATFLLFKNKRRFELLAFRDYFLDVTPILKSVPIFVIGYDEQDLKNICNNMIVDGFNIVGSINGFSDYENILNEVKKVDSLDDTVFLIGQGQPKQEETATFLVNNAGVKKILCIGGGLSQEYGFSKALNRMRIITPLFRFWRSPATLFKRTFMALPSILWFFNER